MRRVVIRNLKNPKPAKPRLFDALVDGDDVYFEIKAKASGSEVIALKDILEQISTTAPNSGQLHRVRGSPG